MKKNATGAASQAADTSTTTKSQPRTSTGRRPLTLDLDPETVEIMDRDRKELGITRHEWMHRLIKRHLDLMGV